MLFAVSLPNLYDLAIRTCKGLDCFSALIASLQRANSETSILKVELSMLHFVKLYLVFAQWIHLVSADGSASHPQVFKDFN